MAAAEHYTAEDAQDVEEEDFIHNFRQPGDEDDMSDRQSSSSDDGMDDEDIAGPRLRQRVADTFEWKNRAYEYAWLGEYTENAGPRLHDVDSSIFDIFHHFIDDDMLQLMVRETNKYARKLILNAGNVDNSNLKGWRDTDVNEVRAFIALILGLGMVRHGRYESHWSTHWLLDHPGFRSIMSRNRFFLLLRCIHLVDDDDALPREDPNYDKAFKIRFFMNHVVNNFQTAFYPSRNVSVDESVIAFKGRVGFKTYHPKKPHKRGMTAWTLADSKTGYVFNSKLHTGNNQANGHATQVTVMNLCLPITDVFVQMNVSDPTNCALNSLIVYLPTMHVLLQGLGEDRKLHPAG
ncbi:uncharacterized protein LOC117100372 isoform X2 [Anneissia japonica]|uniref:uncharacterized protein LOC117100372 isoform X2 n=1 Tax=Anneissia japonica TaxID=1529436 RepID=UPI001425B3E3|nr:uncharacterized protein LOC117100372 isoform X2 [Anneissia japonica]